MISLSNKLPPKDPSLITSEMKKVENCPCMTVECIYKGYCGPCANWHATIDYEHCVYCSLPPGRDKYVLPWEREKGMLLHETYETSIKIPPPGTVKKPDYPCNIYSEYNGSRFYCAYNGYSEQCKQHSEKYQACAPSESADI